MLARIATPAAEGDETMRMKEVAEYEHPSDYVVISLAMRDRIMARLSAAEATVAVLTRGIREHRDAILRSPGGGGGADHSLWLLIQEKKQGYC